MAAFLDGRLHPEARAEVVEHMTNCPDCYALVSAGWDYQAMEQKELAPVVKGRFGSWWIGGAAAAVAASVVILFALPMINFQRDRNALIAAQNAAKLRPVEGRLTGFLYQPFKRYRGGDDARVEETNKYAVDYAAGNLNTRKARSAHQWQAQSAAHLLVGERSEAIEAIEKAAALSPNEPSILNDRVVAYLEQADAQRALDAAQRAWQVAQTPEIAFNRALALEANHRDKEAIAAWQAYLKLDPDSPWATDAKQHLQWLQEPY